MRGQGIPIHIRREIAKLFKASGFTKSTKLEAQKLYEDLSKSDRILHR